MNVNYYNKAIQKKEIHYMISFMKGICCQDKIVAILAGRRIQTRRDSRGLLAGNVLFLDLDVS